MEKQALTPKDLFALFAKMKGDDQRQFLRQIGGYVTSEALYEMTGCMTDREKEGFLEYFDKRP